MRRPAREDEENKEGECGKDQDGQGLTGERVEDNGIIER